MIKTVTAAFTKFLQDCVNLDPKRVECARTSKDNIIKNIHNFSNDDFFNLYQLIDIQHGSFARKTKCRELDDIDLMIGLSAEGCIYYSSDPWDDVTIKTFPTSGYLLNCKNEDDTLNSTKVLNAFKDRLEDLNDYSKSSIHRNGQAVTVNLKSRDWSFDIVPCFITKKDSFGTDLYLIPNGNGKWMKTDPRIDRNTVTEVNKSVEGRMLELIRLCKKWNKVKHVKTVQSYMLETIIVNYCDTYKELDKSIYINFIHILKYLSYAIYNSVIDMKGIQGNLNNLKLEDRNRISDKAECDLKKSLEAIDAEKMGDNKKAINLWRDIFGEEFPEYEC